MPVGEVREKTLEGVHPVRDALAVVEPVDADDHGAPGQAANHIAHERHIGGAAREFGKGLGLDSDREHTDLRDSPVVIEAVRSNRFQADLGQQITREIIGIGFRLEADEVEIAKRRNKPLVIG